MRSRAGKPSRGDLPTADGFLYEGINRSYAGMPRLCVLPEVQPVDGLPHSNCTHALGGKIALHCWSGPESALVH